MTTEEEIAALKEMTRVAHEALADLKRARKEAQEFVATTLDTIKEMMQGAAAKEVATLGDATTKAIDEATATVFRRFDRLENMLLGDGKRREPMEELVQKFVASGGLE